MHYDSNISIPKAATTTADGAEFSAVILEALSWESYYSVSPVFYEEILYARAAKDAPDKEMVKLILSCRSYDPGQYYDGTSGLHEGTGYLGMDDRDSSDVSSVFTTYGGVSQKNVNKINNLVNGLPYED